MSATKAAARPEKAVAELVASVATLKANSEPTPTNRAIAELLSAFADYWKLWLPSEPSRADRAVLNLARAISAPTDAAAGSLPHSTPEETEGKAS